ncbi:hypothetical protein [Aquimarina algicola]|uniref:Bacteriocin n=1 Tax=Aquimarina algicola TaxID=2589995 RepID=A0A504J5M4_9FLAO|nr:hypothetical protein [Aquimarina algicola]TPN82379.1 hypothetical protein FHK87_23450 [Aquimarina algicola]
MKKILELSGIQKLTREQQQNIKGAFGTVTCCPTGRGCLLSFGGESFCEPGYCDRFRPNRCILA